MTPPSPHPSPVPRAPLPGRPDVLRVSVWGQDGHASRLFVRLIDDPSGPSPLGRAGEGQTRLHLLAEGRRSLLLVDATRGGGAGAAAQAARDAEIALVLVDAATGVLPSAIHHTHLAHLFGIRRVVLAVDGLERVTEGQQRFVEIATSFRWVAERLNFASLNAIPLAAALPWYEGPGLLDHLATMEGERQRTALPFRMALHSAMPGTCSGMIVGGSIHSGDQVVVTRTGRSARVTRVRNAAGLLDHGRAGEAVTLELDEAMEIAADEMLAAPRARPEVSDQFAAHLIWLGAEPMLPARSYLLRIGSASTPASVTALRHKIDLGTLHPLPATTLAQDEIGYCNLETASPIAFDPFLENRDTGAFVLLDRYSGATVGLGMIAFGLRRASNIHHQHTDVDKAQRAALKRQKPCVLWFTGLSGAGKSSIANQVERRLAAAGAHTYLMDGDNVRHGLNKDLGFTGADRVENIRRVGEVARLMVDAGLIVICSFISPFRAERRMIRELLEEGEFVEIFVDTPLTVCMARDPKGLYAKAREGLLKNFTGIDSPYERPEHPELAVDASQGSAEELSLRVVDYLRSSGRLG